MEHIKFELHMKFLYLMQVVNHLCLKTHNFVET